MKKLLSALILALILTFALFCVSCKGILPQDILPKENTLEFKLSANEKYYTVVGIGTCTDTDIVIPDTYNYLPVTKIEQNAFKNCSSITSITIPESIISIGSHAFYGCDAITSITIPKNAILNDKSLEGLPGVTILNLGRIQLHFPYDSLKNLETVNIIEGAYGELTPSTFENCVNLKTVNFSSDFTKINIYAFDDCPIENYNVAEGNPKFSSIDGVLYNQDGSELIAYPHARRDASFTVLDITQKIGSDAFYLCMYLETVVLPHNNINL